jgi:hypothetical protein
MLWIPLGLCLLLVSMIAIGLLLGPDDRQRP